MELKWKCNTEQYCHTCMHSTRKSWRTCWRKTLFFLHFFHECSVRHCHCSNLGHLSSNYAVDLLFLLLSSSWLHYILHVIPLPITHIQILQTMLDIRHYRSWILSKVFLASFLFFDLVYKTLVCVYSINSCWLDNEVGLWILNHFLTVWVFMSIFFVKELNHPKIDHIYYIFSYLVIK